MKICNSCKEWKPKTIDYFYKSKTGSSGLTSFCKDCINTRNKKYNAEHPEALAKSKEKYKNNNKEKIKEDARIYRKNNKDKVYYTFIKQKYGLTESSYKSISDSQNNCCKICGERFKDSRPHIDHCHKTGEVRGILCKDCNLGLGRFKDNPDLLLLACDYLLDFMELKREEKTYDS